MFNSGFVIGKLESAKNYHRSFLDQGTAGNKMSGTPNQTIRNMPKWSGKSFSHFRPVINIDWQPHKPREMSLGLQVCQLGKFKN